MYCNHSDDEERTFFYCIRWSVQRDRPYDTLGCTLILENIVNYMINSQENWTLIQNMARNIMSKKGRRGEEEATARRTDEIIKVARRIR